jgi:multidrug efflux pump subunit AcrB
VKSFLRWFLDHPLSTLMLYLALILFGVVSFPRLKGEYLPTILFPEVRVVCEFENISAEEIERQVTVPLENVLSGVSGVKELESLSRQGISSILLRFSWGTDSYKAALEVREKIDSAYPYLPHGIEKPLVFTERGENEAPFILVLRPKEGTSIQELDRTIRYDLKTRLMQVEGIATVRLRGITSPEVKVLLDPDTCTAAGLALNEVPSLLASSVFELPIGKVNEGGKEHLIKASTDTVDLSALQRIAVPVESGSFLSLGEIAEVRLGHAERTSFFSYNGEPCVGAFLWPSPEEGTLNASRTLRRELTDIRRNYANDIEIIFLEDGAERIRSAFRELAISLILGSAAAFLVMVIFLRSLSSAVILLSSLPAAIIPIFFFQYLFGLSLNVMSLTGIAIGIGMIVDNSIVVLERIQGRRDHAAIAEGVLEMGSSTFGSTMTTLLVFLPIVFVPGIIGILFRELAITISLLLIFSFLVSMSLTPALYVLISPKTKESSSKKIFDRAESVYGKLLHALIARPFMIILLIIISFAALFGLAKVLPKETMPSVPEGRLQLSLSLPADTPFDGVEAAAERFLQAVGEAEGISGGYAYTGYEADNPLERAKKESSLNDIFFTFFYAPQTYQREAILKAHIEREAAILSVGKLSWPDSSDPISRLLSKGKEIRLRFSGRERENVLQEARAYRSQLLQEAPESDPRLEESGGYTELRLVPDQLACRNSGITPSAIAGTLKGLVEGSLVGTITLRDEEIDIRVQIAGYDRLSRRQVEAIPLQTQNGFVKLGNMVRFERLPKQRDLYRYNRVPSILLFVKDGNNTVQTGQSSATGIKRERLDQSSFAESMRAIIGTFAIALVLMYLFLGAQFESFSAPLLLMIVLPLSACGSFLFLTVTGRSLNINSGIGILILFGTAINTTIILKASFLHSRNREELIRMAGGRLRPVFLTTATTVTALLPLMLNGSPEATLQAHTATSVIGGLLIGTVLSLLIFPALDYVTKHGSR